MRLTFSGEVALVVCESAWLVRFLKLMIKIHGPFSLTFNVEHHEHDVGLQNEARLEVYSVTRLHQCEPD